MFDYFSSSYFSHVHLGFIRIPLEYITHLIHLPKQTSTKDDKESWFDASRSDLYILGEILECGILNVGFVLRNG